MIPRLLAAFLLVLPCVAAAQKSAEAAATAVVYNSASRDSEELAEYYASKRGIPKENVIGLKCSKEETISRKEFDDTIAGPLREEFVKRGIWKLRDKDSPQGRVDSTKVRFMALMRGMPLRIGPHFEAYEGDKTTGPQQIASRNEASLDSELSLLGMYSRQISGALNNPYFRAARRFPDVKFNAMMLVCRIDAASQDTARRMIDDALAAEERGLHGIVYVDSRGTKDAGLAEGDKWLESCADIARRQGYPAVFDNGEAMFPAGYPMTHAAAYFGWYSEHIAGPFVRPGFKFERGAVAVHIHSFSAVSLRDRSRYWCAPLLELGAAATVGNVYEPFLGLTPQLDVLFDRMLGGFNFAESAYMSQRFLSWQTTFIGDPLYRPWPALDLSAGKVTGEWSALKQGAETFHKDRKEGAAQLMAAARKYRSGFVAEGLGLLQISVNDKEGALDSFALAEDLYKEAGDVMRVVIHEIFILKGMNRNKEAIAIARKRLEQFYDQPASEVVRLLEAEMSVKAAEKRSGG